MAFEAIAERIKVQFPAAEVVVKKTICSATEQRQDEIRRMAAEVQAIVVVGGKDSANTLRLASIARECGAKTQLVETEMRLTGPRSHCVRLSESRRARPHRTG